MPARQTLPDLWLLSDERNDALLEGAIARLPSGSGFVFRHYHLAGDQRRERYDALTRLCRARDHWIVLAGDYETARAWGADGVYAGPTELGESGGLLRMATVHDGREIALADEARVDAMFLSPVFSTRSHPEAEVLGTSRFLRLAAQAQAPVIALGGMNAENARELGWPRWAGIDGLS